MTGSDKDLEILASLARTQRILTETTAKVIEPRRTSPSARRTRSPSPVSGGRSSYKGKSSRSFSRRSRSPERHPRPLSRSPERRSRHRSRSPTYPACGRGGINKGYKSRGSNPRYRAPREKREKDVPIRGRASVEEFLKKQAERADQRSKSTPGPQPDKEILPDASAPVEETFDFDIYSDNPPA